MSERLDALDRWLTDDDEADVAIADDDEQSNRSKTHPRPR
jgi:hypothetical protein